MILYIKKTSKTPPEKLLELINEIHKVLGYKSNIQKSAEFLLTNNEIYEKEI